MKFPKQEHSSSEKHRRFIASLPCCRTGIEGQTQAAHIRIGAQAGLGRKPSDSRCIPLSCSEHFKQHSTSESLYWGNKLDQAIKLASELYESSGDTEKSLELIKRAAL